MYLVELKTVFRLAESVSRLRRTEPIHYETERRACEPVNLYSDPFRFLETVHKSCISV
jgi:hypothetical protein